MDDERFDGMARRMAASASRRSAFRLMGGGAFAALLSRLGGGVAVAQEVACKQHPGAGRCRTDTECCSRLCGNRTGRCKPCRKAAVCSPAAHCGPKRGPCRCYFTTEGKQRCFDERGSKQCNEFPLCPNGSRDCPEGSKCATTCCPNPECIPLCVLPVTGATGAQSEGSENTRSEREAE